MSGATPLDARSRRAAIVSLALAVLLLLVAAIGTGDTERVTFLGREGPPCLLRSLVDERACPGCGLSRSAVLAAEFRLADAVRAHAAGPLLLACAALLIPLQLDRLRRGATLPLHRRSLLLGRALLVGAFAGAWLSRILV